ncbi:MAG: bifunctional diaminohydroxyphosphoribosylaminopyrimidine deaminase/5-amino-6-(5-phosphoribosylamino)uracil reductase RibD [Halothiobacillaceae bacterium]|nr:bifunctional diaminohydroxyphosphoribosylaminopyrimidine deaminase/5-amino-6-(5-phosphoribosylamino)uracil reductase RibD [Halothiobacillaceae bacterium]
MLQSTDIHHMARALQLAHHGLYTTDPNPRVGCIIVRDGVVVGEGFHARAGEPHAEVHALNAAGERSRGATAYVTLEPCSHHGRTPPCAPRLAAAGVTRVVTAMEDPNPKVAGRGHALLREAGVEVLTGVLEAEAQALNEGFVKRMRTGRPLVRVKLGASLDARTALADGASQWITGPAARADVQRLRARSSLVLSSARTVREDGARLDVRLSAADLGGEDPVRQPVRLVLDREGRLGPDLPLFDSPAPVWVAVDAALEESVRARLAGTAAQVLALPVTGGRFDLPALLDALGAREINELLVEAGPRLAGAFLAAQLVDELVLYVAPTLLGDAARPLAVLPGPAQLAQRLNWRWADVRQVGDDLRLTLRPR